MQEKQQYNEERTDFIVGMIVIIMALALFGFLVARIGRNMRNNAMNVVGEISAIGETRRGSEQTFTYDFDTASLTEGEHITWTVNGETVCESTYKSGEEIKLFYTPQQTGALEIVAKVGKYTQAKTVEILAPRLTVTAPDVTIVYGEALPELNHTVSGFVATDDTSDFCYDGACVPEADRLDVGVYEIKFDRELNYKDYETDYVYGTLTVLPKQLEVVNDFSKTYDSTNTIENPKLKLAGIVDGDEVSAECDTLYFDNKNVGCDKTIMLANACLVGENACNYVLPDFVYGNITPKTVNIVGLTVKDKLYDGTTKATIDKMGTLKGVCDGDSVAIGNINVHFDSANVGTRNVVTSDVTLIGADKDNYVLQDVETKKAEINDSTSFWDKILDRAPTREVALARSLRDLFETI